ncbi:MAG: histidinol-phosphatase [Tannerella sp.]|jgi:histidinol-phosphatase (PHP family)|nr:histidinol-phosphatase [Tannerella sp.]
MRYKTNFHSHCSFCDGRSEAEDFVKAAVAENFRAYGFSSHSPLPFETFWNMSFQDMSGYMAEIKRLKEKYSGELEIYAGLEIDYLNASYNASIPYFQELPLDYRISSIHYMPLRQPLLEENMLCIDGAFDKFEQSVNRNYQGDIKEVVKKFFETSMKMVETGGFDMVGHIDKIYMNGSRHKDFDIQADWYQKPFLELLDLIAEKGLIIEINAKNKVAKGHTFPHINSYKELYIRHIPITVNADSHYTNLIYSGISETIPLLMEAGFRTQRELVAGKWEEVELKRV